MNPEHQNAQFSWNNFTLWEVAQAIAVTAELSNTKTEKAKHARPRLRAAPIWLASIGFSALVLFGLSFLNFTAEWPHEQKVLLHTGLGVFGFSLSAAGVLVWLGDTAYHSLSKAGRWVSPKAWGACVVLTTPFMVIPVIVSLVALLRPNEMWSTGFMPLVIIAPPQGMILLMLATSIAAPLVTTSKSPRLYQSRASQTMWTFSLAASVFTIACSSISFLLSVVGTPEPNYDIIVLVSSVAIGLIGAVTSWHRKNIERLERLRVEILDGLGNAIDAIDTEGVDSPTAMRAIRALGRLLTPSPFHSQSIAALPHAASYEVAEMLRLMEWSTSPNDDQDIPLSVALRAQEGRPESPLFTSVISSGNEGVKQHSRAFLARCYQRLKYGSERQT